MELDITIFGDKPGVNATLARDIKAAIKTACERHDVEHVVIASCNVLPARDGSRQPTTDYTIEHMGRP